MMQVESVAPVLLSWLARTSAIFVLALLVVRVWQRRSAALRHALLTAAVIASLFIPALSALGVTAFVPPSVAEYPRAVVAWLKGDRGPIAQPNVTVPARTAPRLQIDMPQEAGGRAPRSGLSALGALALVWLIGTGLLVLRLGLGRLAAARIRRRARPVTDPTVQSLVRRIAATQGLTAAPELRVSDALGAPATLGCVRPAVLLPAAALSWPVERLHPVLAHELAHIVRRDCLTTLLGDLACALYWCNPLVWLVTRRMTVERERACDDCALSTGVDPTQYGLLLLDIAHSAYAGRPMPVSVLMMACPRELESRLLAIVRGSALERGTVSRRSVSVIAAFMILLGTVAAGHAATSQPPAVSALLEPDRRADTLASPLSERLPLRADAESLAAAVRSSALWSGPDSAIVRRLVSFLPHVSEDPRELGRERAIWALTRARGDRLVEPLIYTLGDGDWRVRAYAAYTLAIARDPRAVPSLVAALEHPVWRLRAMAAWALLEIGDAAALRALVRSLDDDAWQVRTPAVSFIAENADRATAARLLQPRLNDRHIAVRDAAADAMVRLSARRQ